MSKHDFFHGTPHDIEVFINQYDKRVRAEIDAEFERMKYNAWLNGLYVRSAVASCLSRKAKYPKEPYTEKDTNEVIVATEDMSDEVKAELTTKFFDNLFEMQRKFEGSKQADGE